MRLLGYNSLNIAPEGHFFSKDLGIRNKLSPPHTQHAMAKQAQDDHWGHSCSKGARGNRRHREIPGPRDSVIHLDIGWELFNPYPCSETILQAPMPSHPSFSMKDVCRSIVSSACFLPVEVWESKGLFFCCLCPF